MSSLSKTLAVLDLFGPDQLQVDPDTIASRMGLSRATVYRYVKDLCEAGLLTRVGAGSYGLGPRIIELDWMMRQYDPILSAGRELMHALAEETGLAVFASVFYDDRIINTYITENSDTYHFAFGRGQPLPLFRGAQSKVLVAYQKGKRLQKLFEERISKDPGNPYSAGSWSEFARAAKRIRKDGYCLTRDELNIGLTGIAAPILSLDDKSILGSLSVVGPTHDFKLLRQETVTDMLVDTTRRIAANMQRQGGSGG
ncbi:IclR family transcriptional regulator [Pseudomonas sp. SLBN-26]|jgi:DNA-binding IclR family transcriptional regulator|uniref:HTH-type transcriptional repressor AllR n=2 Tax=Metapseudomonas otitidis TaxID=319939 RepID=A0A1I0TVJ1_9GAMM|nr:MULTISPECIES: IclR family transcriptional regulator [Pseudomonas]MCP1617305.1 DNA-binding IclR family transcriptional regulator [Pseudomonas otitidis]MDH0339337.1 IclR family transcriptional regulator [Pseudomonas otitidis]MDI6524219.1 IclR family transcriptional regulator [Pseudomonas otitidis]MDU9400395.1 IclR family transcriptional regulator [Pseudomonas sp. zfem003]TQL06547.1 IclR family transcriptional regulator [Pseudomonas sp. SLBN-26]